MRQGIINLIVAATGALVGYIVNTFVEQSLGTQGGNILVPYNAAATSGLTASSLVNIILGALVALFGNRIHALVRWVGVGWVAGSAGAELQDWYTASQAGGA
jgi:hypothetical protein